MMDCGYMPPNTPRCSAPATIHFKARHEDGRSWVGLPACAEHQHHARHRSVDEHPIGPGCGDTSLWVPRRPPAVSFCVDEDGDTTIHEAVRAPARVLEAAR